MPRLTLCDCAVCGNPVPDRPYQAITVRVCSPQCAKALAYRENPELEPSQELRDLRSSGLHN
jgi:hypothetical protein